MKLLKENRPALLLIDIQKAFDDIDYWGGERNNLEAEKNAGQLLKIWRENELPVFHVKHNSSNPNSMLHESNPKNEFKEEVKPLTGETIIRKNVNSAFIGTDLKEQLDQNQITHLVIVGLTTDHCVSTTTRMAGNYGYTTFLVADATATFNKTGIDGTLYSAELIHQTALASLNDEFAKVVTTDLIKKALK